MAKSGPPPKPADRRQGHRKPAEDAPSLPAPAADTSPEHQSVPAPPAELSEALSAHWETYWASVEAAHTTEVNLPAIGRLFVYYDEWARSLEAYREERVWVGSTGQPKISGHAEQMLRFERAIADLEAELGLTPNARAKLGLTIGQAQLTVAQLNAMAEEPAGGRDDDPADADLFGDWEAV